MYFYTIHNMPSALFDSIEEAERAAQYQCTHKSCTISYYRIIQHGLRQHIVHVFTDFGDS